jgi:sensor domain CHASE-containing protein
LSLRYRTALATVFSVIAIMAALLLAYRFIVLEAYSDLEHDHAREELSRTRSVLRSEERALDILLTDWAQWDDMYSFVETRSPAFIASNLPPGILGQLNVNAVVVRNLRGENVIGIARDGDAKTVAIAGLTDRIPNDSALLRPNAEGHVTGIIPSALGPLVISARPILMSDGSGVPRGTVLMARLLNDDYTGRIAEMLTIGVDVYPPDSKDVPESIRTALAAGPKDLAVVGEGPDGHIAAYACLFDLAGNPSLILRTHNERTIEAQSGETLRALLITVGLTGLVLVGALMAVIQFTVVGRLRHLLDEMSSITGRGSSEGLRTHVTGRDEIGDVASGVNAMLDRLGGRRRRARATGAGGHRAGAARRRGVPRAGRGPDRGGRPRHLHRRQPGGAPHPRPVG